MQNNIGELLDALGVTADLEDGELVSGAVVLIETVDDEGEVGLQVLENDTVSWIRKVGMLKVALSVTMQEFGTKHDHHHDHDEEF